MNKTELINMIQGKNVEVSKKTISSIIDSFEEVVSDTMANNGEINLSGFVKFYVADVAEREGVNPKTGEKIPIPAHKAVKVRVGKSLKESVK